VRSKRRADYAVCVTTLARAGDAIKRVVSAGRFQDMRATVRERTLLLNT
jgi:hypothetical protein